LQVQQKFAGKSAPQIRVDSDPVSGLRDTSSPDQNIFAWPKEKIPKLFRRSRAGEFMLQVQQEFAGKSARSDRWVEIHSRDEVTLRYGDSPRRRVEWVPVNCEQLGERILRHVIVPRSAADERPARACKKALREKDGLWSVHAAIAKVSRVSLPRHRDLLQHLIPVVGLLSPETANESQLSPEG
jgi:hypothetical protein